MENSIPTSVAEKTFAILEKTKTNWSVNKLPLVTKCGKITDSYGLFRSDNDSHLGTFKESYSVMQNAKLLELLIQATEQLDLEITRGGTLKDGGRIYYQAALPDEYIGKSSVKRYVSALNSHDGSSAIAFGSSNTVVICNNTFNYVHREMDKVKHTINANDRVKVLVDNLRQTIAKDILMMENFKRMADLPMRDEIVEKLVSKLFNAKGSDQLSDLSTRSKNQIVQFSNDLQTEINLEGKTIWGLFNAVTRYTNHSAAPKGDERKAEYLTYGTGAKLSSLAYNELLNYVTKNTAAYHLVTA
jgi:phage/plasmid-like protein (TIGR03299 family)